MKKISALATTAWVVGLLTACGGGSNDYVATMPTTTPTVTGTDVPVSATTDVTSAFNFAKDQLANTSESSDPLVLGNATLAVDDMAEPAPV